MCMACTCQSVHHCSGRLGTFSVVLQDSSNRLRPFMPLETNMNIWTLQFILRKAAYLSHERVVWQDEAFQLPQYAWIQPQVRGCAASSVWVDEEPDRARVSRGVNLTIDSAMNADVRRSVLRAAEMDFLLFSAALNFVRGHGEQIVIHARFAREASHRRGDIVVGIPTTF